VAAREAVTCQAAEAAAWRLRGLTRVVVGWAVAGVEGSGVGWDNQPGFGTSNRASGCWAGGWGGRGGAKEAYKGGDSSKEIPLCSFDELGTVQLL
jgi:hypothetical protein